MQPCHRSHYYFSSNLIFLYWIFVISYFTCLPCVLSEKYDFLLLGNFLFFVKNKLFVCCCGNAVEIPFDVDIVKSFW